MSVKNRVGGAFILLFLHLVCCCVLRLCCADKDNIHHTLQQLLRSRRENVMAEHGWSTVLDAARSLDVSDDVASADLLSMLIGALTTMPPCAYSLQPLVH